MSESSPKNAPASSSDPAQIAVLLAAAKNAITRAATKSSGIGAAVASSLKRPRDSEQDTSGSGSSGMFVSIPADPKAAEQGQTTAPSFDSTSHSMTIPKPVQSSGHDSILNNGSNATPSWQQNVNSLVQHATQPPYASIGYTAPSSNGFHQFTNFQQQSYPALYQQQPGSRHPFFGAHLSNSSLSSMGSTSQDPNISNSRTPAANTINRLIDTDGAHDTNADKQGTPSTAPASNPARDFLVNPNQVSSLQEYRTAFQRNETSLPANVAHPRFLNAHIFNASTSVTGNGEPSAVFGIPPLPREDASATAGDVPVAKKQRKSTAKRAEQAVARAAADASHGNVKESEGAIRPRQRNKWTDEEILALAEGMQVYGTNWAGLLNDPRFKGPLERRSQMQCKDKAAVEKEKRVKEALKEGRIVTIEELGVWRYACDRKRTFKAVGGVVQQQQQETGTGESPVDLVAGTQGDGGSSGPVGAGAGLVG